MRNRFKIIVATILIATVLSGCWSRREIESLAFVLGTGLDVAESEEQIRVSVQVARPQDLIGSLTPGAGSETRRPVWIFDVTGNTPFDAVRNLRASAPRILFWGHSRVLIIGEELARRGITHYLDFFVRDAEPRLTMLVMVAKGTTANDILKARFGLEENPAEALFNLTRTRTGTSQSFIIDLNQFVQRLQDEGIEPFASRVERQRLGSTHPVPFEEPPPPASQTSEPLGLRLTGLAVFKHDRLVGWLGKRETRGFLWIMGETRSGIAVIPTCPDGTKRPTSIELIESPDTNISVSIKDGRPAVDIRVRHESVIGDTACDIELTADAIQVFEKQLAEVVENEMQAAIDRAKLLGSDIFGFGRKFKNHLNQTWNESLKGHWDEWFRKLDVTIHVESFIRKSGLISSRFVQE